MQTHLAVADSVAPETTAVIGRAAHALGLDAYKGARQCLVNTLSITVTTGEGGRVITLAGEADVSNALQLMDVISAQRASGATYLTIDAAGLSFADSRALSTLAAAGTTLKTLRSRPRRAAPWANAAPAGPHGRPPSRLRRGTPGGEMKALLIPADGPPREADLPGGGDTRFMRSLRKLIATDCAERIQVTTRWEAWLDENGSAAGKPVNEAATRIARAYGRARRSIFAVPASCVACGLPGRRESAGRGRSGWRSRGCWCGWRRCRTCAAVRGVATVWPRGWRWGCAR